MHPEIDRFAHLDSPVHRWDPRWKLAGLFLLMLAIGIERPGSRHDPAWARDLPPAAASLVLALGLVALSRIPISYILRKLRGVALFLLIVLAVFPWTYPGDRIRLGFLSLSSDGILVAVLIGLRAFAIVLVAVPAFGTAPFDVTMKALRCLRLPAALVQIIVFAYRYLFVYSDQLRRMQIALRARGFRPRTDLRTLRAIGNGLGVLLVGSIERTARIQSAMKSRGFSGVFWTLHDLRTRPGDVLLFAAAMVAATGLAAWRLA